MTSHESVRPSFDLSDETFALNENRLETLGDHIDITYDHETWKMESEDDITTQLSSSKGDNIVEHYFNELRQHSLLSLDAERVLWHRIEHRKTRVRRALWLSPTSLHTLTRLWNHIKHGEISLEDVLDISSQDSHNVAATSQYLANTVVQLHELAADLGHGHPKGERPLTASKTPSVRHRERAQLLHKWVNAWQALPLQPTVYETLQLDLEREIATHPDNARLRAVQRSLIVAKRQLNAATAQMLSANLRLVVHMAKRFYNSSVPLLDLIQEGNLGLMRAIEKFEPHRGVKFVTYAHWWVRQAIGRALISQGRTIRLPGHVVERQHKVRAATDQLWHLSGQAPTAQEIGKVLGWTPQEVEQLQIATQATVPLDQRLSEDERTIAELIEDSGAEAPNAAVEDKRLKHCLKICLDSLKPREAMILRRRFGFETGQPQTLREVGDDLGLSRERVRQIEKATLKRIRASSILDQLEDFIST